MKLPISWLKDYVAFDATPQDLADKLTFAGIEVEAIETVGSTFEGIVVGEIMAIEPHPAADRLQVCRVSNGREEWQVVCGAPGIVVGQKAPFAGVGTTLPNGLKLKRAKLRGVESLGMLCAEDELGLSDDHTSLMAVDPSVATGTPFSEVMGPPETILHLEVTWNRPDWLSVIGVAREVAALYGLPLTLPEPRLEERGEPVGTLAAVRIEDEQGCPRYTARVLSGVRIAESPRWMRDRLTWAGVRPINNVVDITNFVMLECGQPLHAFDHALLAGSEIVVRRARAGETMATLDGNARPITPEMLMIADAERPVAVAGIMGGAGSEIRDDTRCVLLESAVFDPAGIHRTSTALGLRTESSHRYERTVDILQAEWASRRAAALMEELCGAAAARGVIDVFPCPPRERPIRCRYERVRSLLGIELSGREIAGIFERLQLPVTARGEDSCTVSAPTFRPDLEIEADLIEEVARMHGVDAVVAAVPSARIVPDADDRWFRATSARRGALVGLGLFEVMHYSFLAPELLDLFSTEDRASRVYLPNPVSADHAVLRNSLVPQLVETLGRNHAHQTTDAAFFEMGRVFWKAADGTIREEDRVSIGLMGKVGRGSMDRRRPAEAGETFLWLKGIVEQFLLSQHVEAVRLAPAEHPAMQAGTAVSVLSGDHEIGRIGLLRKDLRRNWRLSEPVAVAELTLAQTGLGDRAIAVQVVPAFPAVKRDMALVVDASVGHATIEGVIRESAPPELTTVTLFDIFSGEGIGVGKKSMAYSLTYRSSERTLTDEEANGLHEGIKAALKRRLNVEIREG